MKKLLALPIVLSLIVSGLSMTACGKKLTSTTDTPVFESTDAKAAVAETVNVQTITGYYKMVPVAAPTDITSVDSITRTENGEVIVKYQSADDYNEREYLTDNSLSSFSFREYEFPQECTDADYFYPVIQQFSGTSFYRLEDHGGMKPPTGIEENFDYEAYAMNESISYLAVVRDENGHIISSCAVEFPQEALSEYGDVWFNSVESSGDMIYAVVMGRMVYQINAKDGSCTKIYELPAEDEEDFQFTDKYGNSISALRDRDGNIIIEKAIPNVVVEDDGYEHYDSITYELYDLTDGTVSNEPFCTYSDEEFLSFAGYGKYRLVLVNDTGLFGLCDDGSREEIINWENSGLERFSQICSLGNGEFAGVYSTIEKDGYCNEELVKLVPGDASELSNKQVVTVGVVGYKPNELMSAVNEFNRLNENYRVSVKEYGTDTDAYASDLDYDQYIKSLQKEILDDISAGDAPDLIYGVDYVSYQGLLSKGVLADLDQFLDGDNEVKRDDIIPGIVESIKASDGKLYTLPITFTCSSIAVKSKYWDRSTWTLDEMIEFFDNAPDTATHLYDGEDKYEMLMKMTPVLEGLIDYEKAECNFDSDDFVKVLEFCNRFVDEVPQPDKGYDGPEAVDAYYTDRDTWFGRDMQLTTELPIDGFSLNYAQYMSGNGDEITLVGFPTNGKKNGGRLTVSGTYIIPKNASNMEGAWKFIEYDLKNHDPYTNPCLKAQYEEYLKADIGAEHTSCGRPVPPLTEEQYDRVIDYVYSCDCLLNSFDDEVLNIITEEAGEYFAGEISAKEAAERIQDRASIIISEKQ